MTVVLQADIQAVFDQSCSQRSKAEAVFQVK